MTSTCAQCGCAMPATRKYCSADCRMRARRIARKKASTSTARQCGHCGGFFMPRTANHAMCSEACRQRFDRERRAENGAEERECVVCAVLYKPVNGQQKACSRNCARERDRALERGELSRLMRAHHDFKTGAAKVAVGRQELACYSCVRWAPCEGSDTGGQCLAGLFLACKPHSGAPKHFVSVEVRA